MIDTLRLLLPALIPSWNFFDAIHASPRIEYALTASAKEEARDWQAFRPRPATVPMSAMLGRLVWNARWNEGLFVVSCAERLINTPTAHSEDEIFRRLAADLKEAGQVEGWLCFRILLISEDDGVLDAEVGFVSEPRRLAQISLS